MINVEDHVAHCGMAREIIVIKEGMVGTTQFRRMTRGRVVFYVC